MVGGMRRIRWESPWTPYVLMLLSAMPLAALAARANPMPQGSCSGIGFGCSLYGWDLVGLVALVVGVPYVTVLGIAIFLLTRLPRRLEWMPLVMGWLGLGAFLVGAAALARAT